MAGCFGYLIDTIGQILFASYLEPIIPAIVGIPSGLGEIGICLWLLIMGVKELSPTELN